MVSIFHTIFDGVVRYQIVKLVMRFRKNVPKAATNILIGSISKQQEKFVAKLYSDVPFVTVWNNRPFDKGKCPVGNPLCVFTFRIQETFQKCFDKWRKPFFIKLLMYKFVRWPSKDS